MGRKFSKSVIWKKIFEKFLEKLLSFPEIYFGHAGTTQSLRNRFFRKKSPKKSRTQGTPPRLATCVICDFGWFPALSRLFLAAATLTPLGRYFQKVWHEKFVFFNFRKTSKLSSILRPRSRSEINFLEKNFEKVATDVISRNRLTRGRGKRVFGAFLPLFY